MAQTHRAKTGIQPRTQTAKSRRRVPEIRRRQRWFYQKNKKLLEHEVNKTFEEILWMTNREFRDWLSELRTVVVDLWDSYDTPPTTGLDEKEIIEQFEQIETFPVAAFLKDQLGKPNQKVILNTYSIGSAANQWFPTMMKTRINTSSDINAGISIYDLFKEDELFNSMFKNAKRYFKLDSSYNYSYAVPVQAADIKKYLFCCKTGRQWISKFESQGKKLRRKYDYWLSPWKEDAKYSGYNKNLRDTKYLTINRAQINKLKIPKQCKVALISNKKANTFRIRVFEKGQKLFPTGFQAFKVSMAQSASNFPPLTAKFIYERYLEKLGTEKGVIWDPSAGWGGRILGAMGVNRQFSIHYIGTDPNTDHDTNNGRTKYHELADFYNAVRTGEKRGTKRRRRPSTAPNTYEIYQCGSEEMHRQKEFKKYREKIDIVFTSPPYFSKELYSEDPEQSARKFDQYEAWRDGFLRPTLETAVKWLRPGGYLVWNIADIRLGKRKLPLEDDSCRILKDLGMIRVEVLKMALANMPGANRTDFSKKILLEEVRNEIDGAKTITIETARLTAGHGCLTRGGNEGTPRKYEPIFVYQKPQKRGQKTDVKLTPVHEEPMEFAKTVSDLASDFERAISGPRINPYWLRAIYTSLEKRIAGKNKRKYFRSFNRCRKNNFFLTEKVLKGMRSGVPQFVHRKVADRSLKNLVGEDVLIQLFNKTGRGKVQRLFAFAEVLQREPGDDPDTVWVKISNRANCAENCKGLTMEIQSWDVLRINAKPSAFVKKTGDWSY